MFSLSQIIELFSVVVIAISIWGIYYFIGRIIATRGRWDDTYGEEDIKAMPPGKGITPPPGKQTMTRKKSL